MLVHDQREVPLVRQHGFSVSPGTAANVAIRVRQVQNYLTFLFDIYTVPVTVDLVFSAGMCPGNIFYIPCTSWVLVYDI